MLKRTLWTLVICLAIAGLAMLWALSAPAQLLALSINLAERFTPYRINMVEEEFSLNPFEFSASLITVSYEDPSLPPLFSAQGVELEMPLSQFIFGQVTGGSFVAKNITYYLVESQGGSPPDISALLTPLPRLPQKIDIQSMHLIAQDENVWIFPLLHVRAEHPNPDEIALIAQADIGQRSVVLESLIHWNIVSRDRVELDVKAGLFGDDTGSEFILEGDVIARGQSITYRAHVNGEYRNVSDFITAFDADAYPFEGSLRLEGDMEGTLERYALDVQSLTLFTPDAYTFSASGFLASSGEEHPAIALSVSGEAERLDALLPLPQQFKDAVTRSDATIVLRGTLDRPIVEALTLTFDAPGSSQISVSMDLQAIELEELQVPDTPPEFDAEFEISSQELGYWLSQAGDIPEMLLEGSMTARGTLHSDGEAITAEIAALQANVGPLSASGTSEIRLQQELLSAPSLVLSINHRESDGTLSLQGSVADVMSLRGMALDFNAEAVDLKKWSALGELADEVPAASLAATGKFLRVAEPMMIQGLSATFTHDSGRYEISGDLERDGTEYIGDLDIVVTEFSDDFLQDYWPVRGRPGPLAGKLRLRPRYATFIADTSLGTSPLQVFATADHESLSPKRLDIDLYSDSLILADLASSENDDNAANRSMADVSDFTSEDKGSWATSLRALPFPIHLTARARELTGTTSLLENAVIEIDANDERLLLRHLDARYEQGEITLRGVVSLTSEEPILSFAGLGLRTPLASITSDLGVQQSIQGELSLRGGITVKGETPEQWQKTLNGRVALAASDTTVSGAAYDQLMSNILGWLVTGATEKTTTFNCSLLQLDFEDGVGRGDSLFIETPRVIATGKARIDLPAQFLDVRMEPRSKQRRFQFPSAVRIKGPLNDPEVDISALQATADLSAQALLLLPSLTLKLFGLGSNNEPQKPCVASV
ncbi:MAG: AsmA-like C-terminal region-containing protein [Pseudomonadota bacterium]